MCRSRQEIQRHTLRPLHTHFLAISKKGGAAFSDISGDLLAYESHGWLFRAARKARGGVAGLHHGGTLPASRPSRVQRHRPSTVKVRRRRARDAFSCKRHKFEPRSHAIRLLHLITMRDQSLPACWVRHLIS